MHHTITMRYGAAYWDATILTDSGPMHFNIRTMNRQQRGQFFGAIRDMAQRAYGDSRR